jgi:hypothetical protein
MVEGKKTTSRCRLWERFCEGKFGRWQVQIAKNRDLAMHIGMATKSRIQMPMGIRSEQDLKVGRSVRIPSLQVHIYTAFSARTILIL